jgi:UDP-glucuronate 4-epimerase
MAELFAEERFDRRHPPGRAGRRALFAAQPACLRPVQSGRLREHPRRLPPPQVQHLVYASSSSVYGGNTKMPFSEHDSVDHPVSLYAATKKANELMAHSYSHLYGLPTTGLRFFTVYGPWGRPDMAYFLFTEAILAGAADRRLQPRQDAARLHLHRRHRGGRGARTRQSRPRPILPSSRKRPDPATSWAPYRVYNIGNHQPVELRAGDLC